MSWKQTWLLEKEKHANMPHMPPSQLSTVPGSFLTPLNLRAMQIRITDLEQAGERVPTQA